MYIDKCFFLIFRGFDVKSDGHFSCAVPIVFGLRFRYTESVESPHGTPVGGPEGRLGSPGKACDISRCSILFETEKRNISHLAAERADDGKQKEIPRTKNNEGRSSHRIHKAGFSFRGFCGTIIVEILFPGRFP